METAHAARVTDVTVRPHQHEPLPVIAMRVTAAGREFVVEPLQDDQELDARATVGIIYWEGAVRVTTGGAAAGRGYLELTGYGDPLRL